MLLAFDDTDAPDGGCTTHLVFRILLALPDLALRGMPRLVRLNPNVPYKTRGNGAVVVPLCVPAGPQVQVGEFRGHEILAFPEGEPIADANDVFERAWRAIEAGSQPDSQPGLVAVQEPPSAWLYTQAVTSRVVPADAAAAVADVAGLCRGERGVVGAAAAAAWPGPPSSFELIAYRHPSRWGTPRDLDPMPFRPLDALQFTFHSWDDAQSKACCVPNTPCPVLCGLRGRDPERLQSTTRSIGQAAREPIDGWLMWASNQASGDHIVTVPSIADAPEWASLRVACKVSAAAESLQGGHVKVALEDASGIALDAIAFEPTKAFRDVVRSLMPGDDIVVTGAWRDGAIQLERLDVVAAPPRSKRVSNPLCACGDRMKSKGKDAGFKCPSCGQVAEETAGTHEVTPGPELGAYEVPVMARRHLHRPASWDA